DFSATLSLVIRELVTPATVSRPERSDRVSEEASFHRYQYFALTPCSYIFPCHMKHFRDSFLRAHIKPVYTPLALRDWFRAAPRNPPKA
ncbi:hypothetical protein L9V11_25750, partial [Salmonella enterica subsp. enterica]|nr:hypothetical protein [Salmonella enterica subsp. enterica]